MRMFRGKALPILLALTVAAPLQSFWLTPSAHAEGPTDAAPYLNAKVVNDNAGKKVLFDNSHGETSGAADWVIDGGFSDFGNALANAGFYVKELRKSTPITLADLQPYDVFVVAEAQFPFKPAEQQAILDYVNQGGSIFFVADHYNADRNKNRWDGSEVFNGYRRGAWADPAKGMTTEEANSAAMTGVQSSDWLAANFGVRFRYNALGDINANNIVAPEQAFGITKGVTAVAMHAGATLAITDPTKAKGLVYLPTTNEKWASAVDQGVYNGGGVAEGAFSAISKVGLGKAAFIGDSSPIEDATPKYLKEENGGTKTTYDGWKEVDDALYFTNLVNWLGKKESYTSLSEVAGLELDQQTPTLPMEDPATSTEPQAEPWAAPSAGYKWWDASTYKPGSYGSTVAAPVVATYSTTHQATLPNAEDFQIRIVVDNMIPYSTLSNFSLGIYLTGGTQVGYVNTDGTWPAAPGYSSPFSVTADSTGHGTRDLSIRIKANTIGSASMRLKQGSNNLKTEAVNIDNVPAEPLPEIAQPALPDKISISAARAKGENQLVTVEGVVTTAPGSFGGQAFYMQDATGGVYVFQSTTGFQVGDTVSVTAGTSLYNNELELASPTKIEKTGTAEVPAPAVVTSLSNDNQGQLVTLKDASISNIIAATPTGSFEFDATTANGVTHVRVYGRTGLVQTAFPYTDGQKVDITGISAIFKDAFQLKPRGLTDFTAVTTPVDPTPVDPTIPVDPTPVDPTIPVDPTPVDPTPVPSKPTPVPQEDKLVTKGEGKAVINETKFEQVITEALKNGNKVTVDLTGQGNLTELNAKAFQALLDQHSESVLQLKTDVATVSLPAADVKKAIEKLGLALDNSKVSVNVTKLDETATHDATAKLNKSALSLMNPISIQVSVAGTDGKSVNLDQVFKPTVTLPSTASTVASTHLAGVMIDPKTKDVYPVPTLFNTADGSIQATFQKQNSNFIYTVVQNDTSFADVAADSYALNAINTLANKFVVSGVSDTTFEPNAQINRADFATLLVRALGIAPSTTSSTFKDVAGDSYYAANVETARELGLIAGYEDGTFRPNQEISREEMAVMIYRALQLTGTAQDLTDTQKTQNLANFQDNGTISDWAKEAAAYAISAGIIQGTDAGRFSPNQQADRAQSATILFRTLSTMNYLN